VRPGHGSQSGELAAGAGPFEIARVRQRLTMPIGQLVAAPIPSRIGRLTRGSCPFVICRDALIAVTMNPQLLFHLHSSRGIGWKRNRHCESPGAKGASNDIKMIRLLLLVFAFAVFLTQVACAPERSLMPASTASSPGELRVSSTAINFGDIDVGSTQQKVETLFAAGGPVTVSSATVNNAEFAMNGLSLPMTIPAGHTASLTLVFRPQSPGTVTDELTLASSAINSRAQVPIVGTGTPGVEHSVTLSWDPSTSEDVTGYNIYRGTQSGGPYSLVNSSRDSNTTATDNHVTAGQTYYSVVATVNGAGLESAYSNQASALIPSP
jgi:hypothetical protein